MEKSFNNDRVLRILSYFKYMVMGAIGGVAVIHTVTMFISQIKPTDSVETIAMGAGAVLAALAAKAAHIL